MSSVLATRKMAGAGNFFVVHTDISSYDETGTVNDGSRIRAGQVLVDLGQRVVGPANDTSATFARVREIDGNPDNQAQNDAVFVAIRDTADTLTVGVAHLGAGTRN
jgi:hypothetical protein